MSKLFMRFSLVILLGFSLFGVLSFSSLPANAVTINEFPIATPTSEPDGIVAGPDGNLWFTELVGDKIGKMTTTGVITQYPIPVGSGPYRIAVGPDGNLWFTESLANKIGKMTTAGVITEYPIPTANSRSNEITAGPDGNLWFTEENGNKIGRITTSGVITEFAVPTAYSYPDVIVAGPDGDLWFTEGYANKIGKMTTAGVITEYPIPTANSNPGGIAVGPDGNLWFTELTGNKIGKMTTTGVITEYPIPTANSVPFDVTAGPDGNLWFTESGGNKIGRITTSGVITEFAVPTANSGPGDIVVGPDGNLWFTEYNGNKIGQIIVPNPSVINISVTPGSLNFGNVNVGQSANQTITITNQTSSTAALTGNVGILSAPFSVVTGGGAFSLAPGQSQTVTVRFSPTAAGGASTNLSISHNATNMSSPTNIPLSGTGVSTSPPTTNPIIFNPPKSLPPVHQCDTNYTYTLSASGGSGGGFKYQLSTGTLPSGMVLDSTTGILSISTGQSISSDIGTYKFSVCAIDSVSQNEVCKTTSIKVNKRQANISNFNGSYSGSVTATVNEYETYTETDHMTIVVANGTATITAGAGQPVTFTGTLTSSGVLAAKWSGFGGHNDVYFDGTGNMKGRFIPVSGQCSYSANGTARFKGKDKKGGTLTMSATWSVSLQ